MGRALRRGSGVLGGVLVWGFWPFFCGLWLVWVGGCGSGGGGSKLVVGGGGVLVVVDRRQGNLDF